MSLVQTPTLKVSGSAHPSGILMMRWGAVPFLCWVYHLLVRVFSDVLVAFLYFDISQVVPLSQV